MGRHILILGAGFGGLAAANTLRQNLDPSHTITIIDKKKTFMMGFVNLWILNGSRAPDKEVPLESLDKKGIIFINDTITEIKIADNYVLTEHHGRIKFDYLIVALGAQLAPEKIKGFTGRGYNLYDSKDIPSLRKEIMSLEKGRIAICIMGMPYKCPPAPFEASLLIDDMLAKNNTRDKIDIQVFSPAPIAIPAAGPESSSQLVKMLKSRKITFNPSSKIKSIANKELDFENETKTNFDILIGIPPHIAPQVVIESGLAGAGEWISVDRHTMQTKSKHIFAVGDITEIKIVGGLAVPKAGIFAERQAGAAAAQIINEINNYNNSEKFDGKGYCFIEVGNDMAGYIEADFYNKSGPVTLIKNPTADAFIEKKKFEETRIRSWLA